MVNLTSSKIFLTKTWVFASLVLCFQNFCVAPSFYFQTDLHFKLQNVTRFARVFNTHISDFLKTFKY